MTVIIVIKKSKEKRKKDERPKYNGSLNFAKEKAERLHHELTTAKKKERKQKKKSKPKDLNSDLQNSQIRLLD